MSSRECEWASDEHLVVNPGVTHVLKTPPDLPHQGGLDHTLGHFRLEDHRDLLAIKAQPHEGLVREEAVPFMLCSPAVANN